MGARPELTELLDALAQGDARAEQELFAVAYGELKRIANANVRRSGGALTINPTSLLHEAWLRFSKSPSRTFADSAHFYNAIAQAMRQILLDLAKRHRAVRHGGELARAELTDAIANDGVPLDDLFAIDAALARLRAYDPELAELVEWHVFAGIPLVEIARIRGVADKTAKRHWAAACAFIQASMSTSPA